MKILLVTTSFPQGRPGREAAGSFVADFAHALQRQAEVAVVAPGDQETIDTDEQGLAVYRYKTPGQPLSTLKPHNPLHWRPLFSTLGSGKRVTLEAARALQADIILALWVLPCGYWARDAARVLNIPYATWALGSDIWSLGKIPLVKSQLAQVLRQAAFRFADGYGLAEDVERISGKTCRFLPSARQLPVCGLPLEHKPPYRLAFLGRWHPNKGIDLLLDALLALSDGDWERIECVRIAGGGPLEALVKQKVLKLVEAGRPVVLEGYKNILAAAELLVWSDVVVVPSRIESIPVVYSDAIQAQRLLLVTPVGDFPTIENRENDGHNLLLTDSVSIEGLVNGMRRILSGIDRYGVRKTVAYSVEMAVNAYLDSINVENDDSFPVL